MYGVLYFIHNEYCSHSMQYLRDNNAQYKSSSLLFSEEERSSVVKAGFIHVPYIPEQVKDKTEMPALPLSDIVRGLEAAIQAVEEHELDLKKAYGSEC